MLRQLSLWQSQIGLGPQGEAVIAMLQEEVERGWWQVMPPKEATLQIESWDIVPLGMIAQTSFDKRETKATSSDTLTTSHSITARGTRTKLEQMVGGHIATDHSKIQKGLKPTNLSHNVLTSAAAARQPNHAHKS